MLQWFRKLLNQLKFGINAQRIKILAMLCLLPIAIYAANPDTPSAWWKWVSSVVSFLTFCVALLVWFADVSEKWKDSLPKRLNVTYWFANHPVIVCQNATLISAADARSWAQQIGAQLIGKRTLPLSPVIQMDSPQVVLEQNTFFQDYSVHMYLTDRPPELENKTNLDLSTGKYTLVFCPDEDSFFEQWWINYHLPNREQVVERVSRQLHRD